MAWLQTSHGQLAGPQEAEALLYAWVSHDNLLPSFGQLRLLQDSMHQVEVFLQHIRQPTPSSTGMIVALHANKPHGMGNIYDHHQSPTACLKACQGQFLSPDAQMLVLEAMPLQQFPWQMWLF